MDSWRVGRVVREFREEQSAVKGLKDTKSIHGKGYRQKSTTRRSSRGKSAVGGPSAKRRKLKKEGKKSHLRLSTVSPQCSPSTPRRTQKTSRAGRASECPSSPQVLSVFEETAVQCHSRPACPAQPPIQTPRTRSHKKKVKQTFRNKCQHTRRLWGKLF